MLLYRLKAGDAATGDGAVATCVAPTLTGYRRHRRKIEPPQARRGDGAVAIRRSGVLSQGRSGASRDIAVAVLRRFDHEGLKSRSRSNPKLPPLKRRVTFFCLKQQKKGNQRKVLFFESRARTFGASAGIFHTGHPCPDEKRPASMQAALRVFYCLR